METPSRTDKQEANDIAAVERNCQRFSDVIDRLFDWHEQFQLLSKPEIKLEDLDMERDFDSIQAIVNESCFVLLVLSKIISFGTYSIVTNRTRLEEDDEEQQKPRHVKKREKMTTVEEELNESIQNRLDDEFEAIGELSFLLDDDSILAYEFSDFRTPRTINKNKHRKRLQALMEKADEMVFLLSALQNHMSKKLWTYQGMLMKARRITKPSSPSCVSESSDKNKRLKKNHDVSESCV